MPIILSASHASPSYPIRQDFLAEAVVRLYSGGGNGVDAERIREIFLHSRIRERFFLMPLDWYLSPKTQEERSRAYLEEGTRLLVRASRECLDSAGCSPDRVNHVIFVSTTGMSAPSLDSYLVNELGLPRTASRLPIWGLGCAAGASGISRALDYCLAHPSERALLVSLETCSLNFHGNDLSKKNLVAMSLFGDGCAAVLVGGDESGEEGPRLLASRSHLFPDSYRIMGWDVVENGLRLVLSPALPEVVRRELAPLVDSFLLSQDLRRADIVHFLAHPGGAKVIDAMRESLGLENGELSLSEEVLRDHGNVSSASVLIVLERWLKSDPREGYGLISAFGPGFSAELALFRA